MIYILTKNGNLYTGEDYAEALQKLGRDEEVAVESTSPPTVTVDASALATVISHRRGSSSVSHEERDMAVTALQESVE